jgi:hypothetical protein
VQEREETIAEEKITLFGGERTIYLRESNEENKHAIENTDQMVLACHFFPKQYRPVDDKGIAQEINLRGKEKFLRSRRQRTILVAN